MDEYKKMVTYQFKKQLGWFEISYLQMELSTINGIRSFEVLSESISIEYDVFQISEDYVKEVLRNYGYPIKEIKKLGKFNLFISDLAKSNKKVFGNKRLDCCKLNS